MDLLDVSLSIPLVQLHYACVCGLVTEQRISEVSSQCLGQAKSPKDRMLGKLIVYAPNPFVVTPMASDKWWSQRWTCDPNSTVQRHFFADIPNPSTSISTGEPVLTVMASERMPEALMAELQQGKMEVLDGLEGLRSL